MAALSADAAHQRAKIGALTRAVRNGERPADCPELREAKQKLAEIRAEDHVRRILDSAPPLSDEQRTRLAELLRPARQSVDRKTVVAERLTELDEAAS